MSSISTAPRFNLSDVRPVDWLRYFGLLIWLLVATLLALYPMLTSEPPETRSVFGWWSAAVLFLLALWHPAVRGQRSTGFWRRVLIVVVLSISAFAVSYFSRTGLGGLLAMVVAAMLPWMLPIVLGVAWVGVLALGFGVWVFFTPDGSWMLALVWILMNLGLMLFPFIASLLALQQMQARSELRRVNAQLMATQSLLAENTRLAERVRISRELHDLVGHHLTALSLNLEVANHVSSGKTREHIEQARSIARLLLADVREVVSDMREDAEVDLRQALEMLAEGVPELSIHLDVPERLGLTDPNKAQVLLRCAQEVITNTVRHARADNLWIVLKDGEGGLTLDARDDGRGAVEWLPGNGLNGMRERLRELGGRLDIATCPGAGFRLRAWMPSEVAT